MRTIPLVLLAGVLVTTGSGSKKKYKSAVSHLEKLRADSLAYEERGRALQAGLFGWRALLNSTRRNSPNASEN